MSPRRWFSLVAALGCLTASAASADTTVGGTIAADTTWALAGSPFLVTSNVAINSGVTLTVELGVTVKLNQYCLINVYGTLMPPGDHRLVANWSSELGPVAVRALLLEVAPAAPGGKR